MVAPLCVERPPTVSDAPPYLTHRLRAAVGALKQSAGALVHVDARVDALIDEEILPMLNSAVARAFAFVAAAPDALGPAVDTAEVAPRQQ